MHPRCLALLALVSACSFPTDGVPLGGDDDPTPDAAPDACISSAELCDGLDNDCDGTPDEDFALGMCDGPDDDQCPDDPQVCSADGSAIECSTTVGDQDVELCNMADDDCDLASDEGFALGVGCDGADSDLCDEGVTVCNGAGDDVDCTDTSGDNVEACNDADDDCDSDVDEDFDLPNNPDRCGACDIQCTNAHGEVDCNAGVCEPICDSMTQDCDGNPITGCEALNTNPNCQTETTTLTGLSGDTGSTVRTQNGSGEASFRITVSEDADVSNVDLRARVRLVSTAGANYDLTVRCDACNGTSAVSNSTDAQDQIQVQHDDAGEGDFELFIEVRLTSTSQSACSPWTLTVAGNTGGTPDLVCP